MFDAACGPAVAARHRFAEAAARAKFKLHVRGIAAITVLAAPPAGGL